jgi:hypothetical protein
VGGNFARRFSPDIGPFASARDDIPESLSALAELVPAGGNIILLQADPIKLPPGIIAVKTAFGVQMVLDRLVSSNSEINKRGARERDEVWVVLAERQGEGAYQVPPGYCSLALSMEGP